MSCLYCASDIHCQKHYPDSIRKHTSLPRDQKVNNTFTKDGYIVLRFWEHDINNDIQSCIQKIEGVR